MAIYFFRLLILSFVAILSSGCAAPPLTGPGMTVTFNNGIKKTNVLIDRAMSSRGRAFPNPGSLGPDPNRNILVGGKTMGAAADGRELPEWVEFEWVTTVRGSNYTREQLSALPIHKEQVRVRERVPQDVVGEVMESNRIRQPGKVADKSLWIYFIWYESGVKFRWELNDRCCGVLRSGGDRLE